MTTAAPRARCGFVPPYLLRHLAGAAAEPVAACGHATLLVDQRLREARAAAPTTPPAARAGAVGSTEPRRVVHDTGNTEELPGAPARADDEPATGDAAVDEAYQSCGQVWDLFEEVYGRASVDGRGTTVSVTVHYGTNYDNAFWDGSQLVFGDGDGQVFDRFTKPMDVMAHEFAHGVTQYTASLTYQGQSGALNESVSDVFAALTRQRVLGQDAAEADWLIGVGLFLPDVRATALRSMLEPGTAYDDPRLGKDPQVGSMADYIETTEDNGGVHLNSGIPNRAFALAARAIGGAAWERAGRVWYDALTAGEVTADTRFEGFAAATVGSARRLFPDDATVAQHVLEAWQQVGLLAEGVPAEGAPAPTGDADTGVDPVGQARTVAVRRYGGVTGITRSGLLDLDADPQGPEVRSLLARTDLALLGGEPGGADRFVYTVQLDSWAVTVPEASLTPELDQVVRIVLAAPPRLDLG